MRLKHQLTYYLRTRDMTASQLARKAGVPKQSLSDWLAGASPRKLEHLKRVADVLNVTIDHLCFGDGHEDRAVLEVTDSGNGEWIEGIYEVRLRRIASPKKTGRKS